MVGTSATRRRRERASFRYFFISRMVRICFNGFEEVLGLDFFFVFEGFLARLPRFFTTITDPFFKVLQAFVSETEKRSS